MGAVSPHFDHEVISTIYNLKLARRDYNTTEFMSTGGEGYKKKGRVYYDAPSPQATSDAQGQWVSANFTHIVRGVVCR